MSDVTDALKPPVVKKPYAGGHIYQDANGRQVSSVTTILSQGVPKPALINWAGEITATYAVDNWQKLARLGHASRYKALRDARFTKSKAATLRGSQLHQAAEAIVQGKPYSIPKDSIPQAEAYARFRDEWHASPLATERITASLEHGYAGTFDLLAMLGDDPWLLDLKTNASGIYPETAIQLSAYRRADWAETPPILERLQNPELRTGAVWLRPDGGYELLPVETREVEFLVFLAAKQIAEWQRGSEHLIGSALVPPDTVREVVMEAS